MDDYIKREDAVRRVAVLIAAEAESDGCEDQPMDNYIEYASEDLADIPSADVAPVRHGEWEVREPMPMHDIKGNLSWGNWYVCTGCGFATTAIEGHITQYRYCPNCGARMDGEDDEL